MSFKSTIQDMKGEFGSISTKVFGSRLRSQPAVDNTSVKNIDDSNQCCWANMPPELLTEVLMRIEASESTWPSRRYVVSCAGVCRNWRKNMKEIVKCPEISGKLTFPISLKQPGSRGSATQCIIERNRSDQTYNLYLSYHRGSFHNGKFLLAAKRFRRPTCTDYLIFLNEGAASKGSITYVGKLRANFLGTKFRVYDAQPPNAATLATKCHSSRFGSMKRVPLKAAAGNYPVSSISYEVHALGIRGPRQMRCVMNAIPANATEPGGVAPTPTEFLFSNTKSFSLLPIFSSKLTHTDDSQLGSLSTQNDTKLVLKNKTPRWHRHMHLWCLNFNGRVTVASVKNFQLVAALENENGAKEHENIILQFGKVANDLFIMDYQYPISAFQAFAICLSSFDTKMACE